MEQRSSAGRVDHGHLVARLAAFYTLGLTALILVTMVILYSVLVQHINADDNNFLADKLRPVRADLAEKKVGQGEIPADDVPIRAFDYFVRVRDRQTGQVVAQRPQTGGRPLPPSVFPSSPADGQIPGQRVE